MNLSLLVNCPIWRVGRERLQWWLHPVYMIQHYCLVPMAALLSCKGISYHDLLLHIASYCLPTVNSRPCPGIGLQSLWSSSQPPSMPGHLCPCPGYVELQQALSVWLLFHSACHRSASALSHSFKRSSTVPNNFPFSSLTPWVEVCSVHSPLFPLLPSSYWVLCGSMQPFQNYNFEFYI